MSIEPLPSGESVMIHAGVVIQSPLSIVKELVENSIDSGATIITVRVSQSLDTITVEDNGEGIDRDQVSSIKFGHTSKVGTFYYGYRGQALSSISAQAGEIHLLTKSRRTLISTSVCLHTGNQLSNKGNLRSGTTLIVKDPFRKIPVRHAFWSDKTRITRQLNEITKYCIGINIISTQLHLTLVKGSTVAVKAGEKPVKTITDSVRITLGNTVYSGLDNMTVSSPTNDQRGTIKIQLFIAKIGTAGNPALRSRDDRVFTYINGRLVRWRAGIAAIKGCWMLRKPPTVTNKVPVVILIVSLPHWEVDLNVCPQKSEVFFPHEKSILDVVATALSLQPELPSESDRYSEATREPSPSPDLFLTAAGGISAFGSSSLPDCGNIEINNSNQLNQNRSPSPVGVVSIESDSVKSSICSLDDMECTVPSQTDMSPPVSEPSPTQLANSENTNIETSDGVVSISTEPSQTDMSPPVGPTPLAYNDNTNTEISDGAVSISTEPSQTDMSPPVSEPSPTQLANSENTNIETSDGVVSISTEPSQTDMSPPVGPTPLAYNDNTNTEISDGAVSISTEPSQTDMSPPVSEPSPTQLANSENTNIEISDGVVSISTGPSPPPGFGSSTASDPTHQIIKLTNLSHSCSQSSNEDVISNRSHSDRRNNFFESADRRLLKTKQPHPDEGIKRLKTTSSVKVKESLLINDIKRFKPEINEIQITNKNAIDGSNYVSSPTQPDQCQNILSDDDNVTYVLPTDVNSEKDTAVTVSLTQSSFEVQLKKKGSVRIPESDIAGDFIKTLCEPELIKNKVYSSLRGVGRASYNPEIIHLTTKRINLLTEMRVLNVVGHGNSFIYLYSDKGDIAVTDVKKMFEISTAKHLTVTYQVPSRKLEKPVLVSSIVGMEVDYVSRLVERYERDPSLIINDGFKLLRTSNQYFVTHSPIDSSLLPLIEISQSEERLQSSRIQILKIIKSRVTEAFPSGVTLSNAMAAFTYSLQHCFDECVDVIILT